MRGRQAAARLAGIAIVVLAVAPMTHASGGDGFVTRSGTQLVYGGQPFRFTGFDIYNANSNGWCGGAMPGTAMDVAIGHMGSGTKVIRAWFFQQLATTNDGVRDWTAFDRTLAAARAHHVKVIATLVDNWGDCGASVRDGYGRKWEDWYAGGYKTPDPLGTESYRDWAAEMATRYRSDPSILAWQLVNEPEDPQPDGSCPADAGAVLKSFATDVSGVIRQNDPNHLISLGTIGTGQCGASGTDQFRDLMSVPTLDLCEFHDYDPSAPLPGDEWNGLQVRIDDCNADGKPLIVGELGLRPIDLANPTLLGRTRVFRDKFDAMFAAGVRGVLLWNWSEGGSLLDNYEIGPGDPVVDEMTRALVRHDMKYADDLSMPRDSEKATPLSDGRVLLIGGYSTFAPGDIATTDVYDPVTRSFTATGSMSTPRIGETATLLEDGSVLVAGGHDGTSYLASAEIWSPSTGSWSAVQGLHEARMNAASVRLPDGRVMVAGGTGGPMRSSVEIFDPATATWTEAAPMLTARSYFTLTLLPDGDVLAVGGWNGRYLSAAETYDPATDTWTATGSLPLARYDHSAVLLENGRVLVTGGVEEEPDTTTHATATSYLYDPAARTWTPAAPMPSARDSFVAVPLEDGSVAAAGMVRGIDLYDPATDSWTHADDTLPALTFFAAAPLPGSRVLIAGGADGGLWYDTARAWDWGDTPSPPLQFANPPAAPENVVAAAGDGTATVAWTPPADDGGDPISGYVVTASPGGATTAVDASHTSATIAGLDDGTAYVLSVDATNAAGTGAPTASAPVTPQAGAAPPAAASAVVAAGGSVSVTSGSLTTGVTSPAGGVVSIAETAPDATAPTSFTLAGQQVNITAPAATAAAPLTIVFTVPTGGDSVEIMRTESAGAPTVIPPCDATSPIAPDPCVAARTSTQITILTSSASRWNLLAPADTSIQVGDKGAGTSSVTLGGRAVWTFAPTKKKAVRATDASALKLFDSGDRTSGAYAYRFTAAGSFAYFSNTGGSVDGTVGVAPLVVGHSLVWATALPAGLVEDVQHRVGSAWRDWRSGTSSLGAAAPAGTYRARLRSGTGAASDWSPAVVVG